MSEDNEVTARCMRAVERGGPTAARLYYNTINEAFWQFTVDGEDVEAIDHKALGECNSMEIIVLEFIAPMVAALDKAYNLGLES